jgi:hypothetical protein
MRGCTDDAFRYNENRSRQGAFAVAHQWPIGFINFVTLITRWSQASAFGDGLGVMFPGPHLAGIIGGADDIEAREGEQQHVGCLDQASGNLLFVSLDFLGFPLTIIVLGQGNTMMKRSGNVARSGLLRPIQNGLERALLEADASLSE